MTEQNKTPREPIPEEFETFEELADFWDTHDLTDYADPAPSHIHPTDPNNSQNLIAFLE